jgi:hypothetical protein
MRGWTKPENWLQPKIRVGSGRCRNLPLNSASTFARCETRLEKLANKPDLHYLGQGHIAHQHDRQEQPVEASRVVRPTPAFAAPCRDPMSDSTAVGRPRQREPSNRAVERADERFDQAHVLARAFASAPPSDNASQRAAAPRQDRRALSETRAVLLAAVGGEPSDPKPVRSDAAADLGSAGPDGLTRDECHEARLAKKGHKRGELSEKCLRAIVFQAVLFGRGRSCRSREPAECRNEKSRATRRVLVYNGAHPGRPKRKSRIITLSIPGGHCHGPCGARQEHLPHAEH